MRDQNQRGSTMPQLLLQGFPDGAMRIGSTLSVLKKEGRVTYFVGPDSYFSHRETDAAGQRLALTTLMANGHVRASQKGVGKGSERGRFVVLSYFVSTRLAARKGSERGRFGVGKGSERGRFVVLSYFVSTRLAAITASPGVFRFQYA